MRGTTSARTRSRLLREAGATEVHYAHQRPAVRQPLLLRHRHRPDEKDLIAAGHTRGGDQQSWCGSDHAGVPGASTHVQQLAIHSKCGFCTGCFTGKYPVAPPTETMDIVYDKPLSQSNSNKKL